MTSHSRRRVYVLSLLAVAALVVGCSERSPNSPVAEAPLNPFTVAPPHPYVSPLLPSSTLTLTTLANSGNPDAQCKLGLAYEFGRGVAPDFSRARTWLEKAAAQHNGCGIVNVGNLYYRGFGVSKDYAAARRFYEAGVAERFAIAYYDLGLMDEYGVGGPVEEKTALEWMRRAATAGYKPAYNEIGDLYSYGKQIPHNIGIAVYYYELAIRSHAENCTCAEENLAYLYMTYYPGKDRNARALKYLKLAQDEPWAEYWMAAIYAGGMGVPKDIALATKWSKRAAENGYAPAETMYAEILMSASGPRHDATAALPYLQAAVAQGDSEAMFILGELYWNGDGLERDRKAALPLLVRSSEDGDLRALNDVANLYYNGAAPFPRDRYKAYILFHVALDQGAAMSSTLRRTLASNLSAEQLQQAQGEIQRLDRIVKASEDSQDAPPPIPKAILDQRTRPAD